MRGVTIGRGAGLAWHSSFVFAPIPPGGTESQHRQKAAEMIEAVSLPLGESMPDFSGLRFFVRDCLRTGRSREQIIAALKCLGWTDAQAERAFGEWTAQAGTDEAAKSA